MRLVLALVIVLLAGPSAARQISDSAGRSVEIPDVVERVFAAGLPAAVLVYVLKPESLLG
jgi:iron complex transport system substrate-binding protein